MFDKLFKYEDGKLLNKSTNHAYCNKDKDGYIRVRIAGKEFRAHRIIWSLFYGDIPENMLIDHIDGDTSNNNINNLRLVTRQQNNANSTKKIKENNLPKGVTLNPSGKYRARLTHNGITYSLGTYKTAEEAEQIIIDKDIELNGEHSVYLR